MALIALMSMSFTTNTSSLEIVETENGSYLKNVELLSLNDLETLEKMSFKGKKTTKVISTKFVIKALNTTIVRKEDCDLSSGEQLKLDAILNKY